MQENRLSILYSCFPSASSLHLACGKQLQTCCFLAHHLQQQPVYRLEPIAKSQPACQVSLDCVSDTTQDHQCCVAPHVVLHSGIYEQRCTFDCYDRLEEAFREVEHKVPESWQNVTGGPTMTLRSLDMRMPNCRYAHTLNCSQVAAL